MKTGYLITDNEDESVVGFIAPKTSFDEVKAAIKIAISEHFDMDGDDFTIDDIDSLERGIKPWETENFRVNFSDSVEIVTISSIYIY